MKIWGNEFHLMFVTDATAVYYGDDEGSPIDHIRWDGYINGVNKVVTFKHNSRAGTYKPENKNRQFYKYVVVEVTNHLFMKSYKILGPVHQFYMWLPKDEQELSRKLWENKDDRKKRTGKKKSV